MGATDSPSAAPPQENLIIEAWRGVAAWMVVYAHFWGFSGSDWPPLRLTHTGVNLFFVVSGFVFAPYLLGRALNGKAHAVRRFFRLYPAYLLALAVYVAMKVNAGQPLRYLGEHLTFLHVQSKEMAFYYNPPFWSLPAEVEFYLLLPLLAGAAGAAQRRWGALGPLRLLMGLWVLAAGLRWALGWASDGQAQNGAFIALHHLPGVLVEFLLGAAAWIVSKRSLLSKVLISLAVSGLAGWWWLAVWFGQVGDAGVDASALKGLMGAMTAMCFAALVAGTAGAAASIGGVSRSQGGQTGLTGLRAVALWAGRLSYGVYLFHIAALRLAEGWAAAWGWTPGGARWLAMGLTLAIAAVVYLAWENPWRMFGRRWAARLSSV
jgi:peptidoglycan/LPS O-acetylase OafA/YrhL